jgi:hypothetical protein
MKRIVLSLLTVSALSLSLLAQTIVTTPSGTIYQFGEWSAPTNLTVRSATGDVQLVQRSCAVMRQQPASPQTRVIELDYYPAAGEVWIGEHPQRYAVVGQKIWGLNTISRILKIKQSEAAGVATNGEALIINAFLQRFLDDPRTDFWLENTGQRIDLCNVFGYNSIFLTAQGSRIQPAEITDLSLGTNSLTIALKSQAGFGLSLRLDPSLKIVGASRGGLPLPVLFETVLPSAELNEWFPPRVVEIASDHGKSEALSSSRSYFYNDAETGEESLMAAARSIVLISTGDLWIGPSECRLAVADGNIIGVMVDKEARELLVFTGPRARVPITLGSRVYLDQIAQFESELRANQYRYEPDYRVKIPDLFAGTIDLRSNTDLGLRGVVIQGKNISVQINNNMVQGYPQILLGPDGKVLSAKLLQGAELMGIENPGP